MSLLPKPMTQHTFRLVGVNFRPAGRAVLPTLSEGTVLILEPEPTNPHDPRAIKVCVDLEGHPIWAKDIASEPDGPIVHLGYIPRIKTGEVFNIIRSPNWEAALTFDMAGEPLVRIEVQQEAA